MRLGFMEYVPVLGKVKFEITALLLPPAVPAVVSRSKSLSPYFEKYNLIIESRLPEVGVIVIVTLSPALPLKYK
jgi:hypothetical protein